MAADIEKNIQISRLLDVYGALLSPRQNEIISMYYNDDLSLGEISELLGVTRQGVRDAVVKGVGLLSDFEEKLGVLGERVRHNALLCEIAEDIKLSGGAEAAYEKLMRLINGFGANA